MRPLGAHLANATWGTDPITSHTHADLDWRALDTLPQKVTNSILISSKFPKADLPANPSSSFQVCLWDQSRLGYPFINWKFLVSLVVVVPQSCSRVPLFVTPWTAARQASLSLTNSRSVPKFTSTASECHPVVSSSDTLFFCPQSFAASGMIPVNRLFTSGDQNTGASASVLPVSIQGWFSIRLTGLTSFLSKGLQRVFYSTPVWSLLFLIIWDQPYIFQLRQEDMRRTRWYLYSHMDCI